MVEPKRILDVINVSVDFDGFQVLNDLNFSINYGELRFLIGPNGAGKSTLLDIITGKTRPSSGQVIFDGHLDLRRWPEHKIVQHGIGRKFQTPSVFTSLSVFQNLEAAIGLKTPVPQLLTKLPVEQADRINAILETIGLTERATVRAGLLSHGQKQWLEIGMLLVQEPKLLLLDEPVAGMTRRERDHTGELLKAIARDRAILVVEHDMQFVRQFASMVTVLHSGKVLCEDTIDVVQNDPRVIEVYLGRKRDQAT
ncbi:MAG: urea ABC transporter ATP-binding protein UrtD [Aggregatilineales bacterium]